MSSPILGLFKDLASSCQKCLHLLTGNEQEIAVLILKGFFPQLNDSNACEDESKVQRVKSDIYDDILLQETNEESQIVVAIAAENFNEADLEDKVNEIENLVELDFFLKSENYNITKNQIGVSSEVIESPEDIKTVLENKSVTPSDDKTKDVAKESGFKCDDCHFKTSRKRYLLDHKVTVHDFKPPLIKCNQCNFVTRREHRLKVHISMEHDGKRRKCKLCSFTYKSDRESIKHVVTAHKDKGVTCSICKKIFARKSLFDIHMLNKHTCNVNSEIGKLKDKLDSMPYAQAKSYITKRKLLWSGSGNIPVEIKNTLLTFGWELEGPDYLPVCNEFGRNRLKKMFR